jgi:NADH-quinone oxidoreductase subunit F
VEILTGKKLGRDFTLEGLKEQGYEAVFLAVGAPLGSKMGIPGEDAEGVVDAMEFNKVYNMRGSVPVGKKVIIIGGGNSAVDAARTALRLGAESVTIVYRRSREDMPAYDEEIEEATHEGVELMMLTLPEAVLAENGKVCGVRCRHMALAGFDRSGRRRPEAAGDSFVLPADQVISAIGQALDLDAVVGEVGVKKQNKQFIEVNPVTGQTSVDWIFGGGDAVTGPDSVVGAVAAGERAAVGIDHMLTGANHAFWRTDAPVPVSFDPEEAPAPFAREKMPTIPVERRKNSFEEVEHCWEAPVATRQAKRCLRCEFGKRV